MRRSLKNIFFFCLFSGSLACPAQTNDAALWMSFNIIKKINPAWSLNLSEEVRLNENITEAGTIFTDFGVNYKLNSNFRFSANYRFITKRRLDDSYDKRHRYYFGLSYKNKFRQMDYTLRLRYQSQYKDIYSSPGGKVPENYIRAKLLLKFDFNKKYTPYIYSEPFFPLNNPKVRSIDNVRYCAGIEYKFNRMHSLDVFYLVQQEYHVKNPERDFVVGVGYYLTF